ncbi:MAG: 16S rRNA (uracil(1498)-N(3))-methyltransferase [Verrucomicrobia bacterium]|nr:16S rRNA (uracil(1498)-N(3))-methyltransferase [Kiritimatiellia bacterium]MCO6399603.1 16S rRNA (uracil(1498)-N(3))-methyltransferase [Verrucomicrobiota bacterium]
MNLLLADAAEFSPNRTLTLTNSRATHLTRVLRVAIGDTVRIGAINGPRGTGTVIALTDHSATLSCTFEDRPPPRPRIDLLLALPRPKVMKRLWAQLAALGVGRIFLTNAARVERNYFDTHVLDPAFFTPLLIEGLQQAQDTHLPEVSIHRRLKPLIEVEQAALSDISIRLIAHPYAHEQAREAIHPRAEDRILLAIGPEGGWVSFELDLLAAHGFRAVNFGSRILRTDTACIAALATLHHLL